MTLARLRESSSRQFADHLALRALFRLRAFTVSRFVLFSSRMSGGGGPYVVEASYPLAVSWPASPQNRCSACEQVIPGRSEAANPELITPGG